MRFHVKRLIVGIWSTLAFGLVLVVLLFREGHESENVGNPLVPKDGKSWESGRVLGTQVNRMVNKERPTKTTNSSKPKYAELGDSDQAVFHPAIHLAPHSHPTSNVMKQPKHAVFNITDEMVAKYKHLYDTPPENMVYSHQDYNVRHVWPREHETEDRIVAQINHKPKLPENGVRESLKILVYNGFPSDARPGKSKFVNDKCSVQDCELIADHGQVKTADVILFQNTMSIPYPGPKTKNQIWVLFFLESAKYTMNLDAFKGLINMTATYRRDSHIVTPYEKFLPFQNVSKLPQEPLQNYAADKKKKVAWFVSNCGTSNGRLNYARELQKYISVDIYGSCGSLHCFRSKAQECFQMLSQDYKFYLAFENSNCKDYITEKLHWNGLFNNIIPVVLGASPEDYASLAPPHSYIHVDDFESPKQLAEYLHILDQNDHLYNRYFLWKKTGEFINTYFWCRLCSMSHEARNNPVWVDDAEKWWRDTDTCVAVEGTQKWASWRGNNKPHR